MFTKKCVLFLGVVLAVAGLASAQAVQVQVQVVAVGWFANATGKAVDGLRIAFDQPVTITGKVEVFGELQNVTGTNTGAEFLFQGKLAPHGSVELRWGPADAKPVLVLWLVEGKPAGTPYVTAVPALVKLLAEGLVTLRDADPQAFTALLTEFFTVNRGLATTLGQLGLSPEILTGMLMVAPAEGVENLLITLVTSFGLDTVEKFMGALDWSLIFKALGL